MALGKRIEMERVARGWQQTELARKTCRVAGDHERTAANDDEGQPTLTQQSLDRLEKRDSSTSEAAPYIAEALGVSLRWLLTGKGSKSEADWPFELVARRRWDECTERERGIVEHAMLQAVELVEEARRTAATKATAAEVAATATKLITPAPAASKGTTPSFPPATAAPKPAKSRGKVSPPT